jgi:hypothetical protein
MAKRKWGSPAEKAALAKARKASATSRRRKAKRKYSTNPEARGQGFRGYKKNTVPYLRANKRSQTAGFNTGSILPGTGKRLVLGGYIRIENRSNKGAIDKAIARAGNATMPYGTSRGKVRKYLKNNVQITNPAIRANVGKHQARLSTSRGAGPTVTLRRGKHKTPLTKSRQGVKRYDTRMRSIAGKKAKRKGR